MALTVVGIFDNASEAQQAVDQLVADGFGRSNIDLSTASGNNVAYSDGSIPDRHTNTSGTRTEELADDAKDTGDSIGSFFSSLFGGNDKNETAKYSTVASQSSVVTVHAQTEDEAERAADILDDAGAVDVDEKATQYGVAGTTGTGFTDTNTTGYADKTTTGYADTTTPLATGADQTLNVIQENLEVGKRTVETGGVRLRSRIVERPVEENLRLREERVSVQRNPVSRPATSADLNAFQEGQIELVEHAEVPVVSKTATVVEEVSIGKEVNEREEVIRDTVRNTEVDVENIGTTDTTLRTDRTGLDSDDVTYSTK